LRLHETYGELADLERSGRLSLPRAAAMIMLVVVPLPVVPALALGTIVLLVVAVSALGRVRVVRRAKRRRVRAMDRLPLLVLADLRHLSADAVEHLLDFVRRNHALRRGHMDAAVGMGSVPAMLHVRHERRPVRLMKKRVVIGMMTLGHGDPPFLVRRKSIDLCGERRASRKYDRESARRTRHFGCATV